MERQSGWLSMAGGPELAREEDATVRVREPMCGETPAEGLAAASGIEGARERDATVCAKEPSDACVGDGGGCPGPEGRASRAGPRIGPA